MGRSEPFGPRPAAHSIFKNPREKMRMEESAAGRAGAYSRPCTESNRVRKYKATTRAERASQSEFLLK